MKKFWLYINTIKYLKLRQVFYLFWYKIKTYFSFIETYNNYNNVNFTRLHFDSYELIYSKGKYLSQNTFCFLNITHIFTEYIDWNIQSHGKLWNYNLQYFDYILDEKHESNTYFPIISSCSDKILKNQLKLEPYPVSLRLINWLLFFSKTGHNSDNTLKAIRIQIAFLEKNLEIQLLGNHYLENLITLLIVSMYIEDVSLYKKISKKIKAQIDEQILEDGGHYECAPMYHITLLSKLLLAYRLLQCNNLNIDIKDTLSNSISKMQGWLHNFCFKNGSYALFNDAAREIAIPTEIINSVFQKTNLPLKHSLLKESGYRKLSNYNFEIIIDVGKIQPSFQPGHTHSDMLSFCLNFKEKEIFIDPGISTYEINEQRLVERGTAFHNTVTINNENQSEIWSSFRIGNRAKISIYKDDQNTCEAKHNGYRKKFKTDICRKFQLFENCLEIHDEIIHNKKILAVAHFYFHPDVLISQIDKSSFKINNDIIISFSKCKKINKSTISIPAGFNIYQQSQKIEATFQQKLKTRILSYI